MEPKYVSVIIPCRNEEESISKCLDSIIAQDYPKDKLEVLVVDGMSEDGTVEIVRSYAAKEPFIRLLSNPKKVIPAAMNIGIRNSKGEVVMKVDAHAVYRSDYISKCIRFLDEYAADNVGGTIAAIPCGGTIIAKAITFALSAPFGVGNSYFRIGAKKPMWSDAVFSGCYRREVFDKIGFYDENIARSEDIDLNSRLIKAGGRILLVPDIITDYYARSNFKDFVKHNFDNGFWITYPLKFGKRLFSLRHLVPAVFLSSLLDLALLSFFSAGFLRLLLFVAGAYILANLYFAGITAFEEKDPRYLVFMPAIFTGLHISYGAGSLYGVLKVVASKHTFIIKRLFDILFSFLGLLILSPLVLVISVKIKAEDGGTLFYRGVRVGVSGRPLRIFKFRTMVPDADKIGGSSTPDDDPRITKIGRFLRRYKLDELPQLINIIKGDMSFVGPRPQVSWAVDLYTDEEKKVLLGIRPGITDYASIKFHNEGELLRGSDDPDKDYMEKIHPEKMRLAMKYAEDISSKKDAEILFKTLLNMFERRS